MTDEELKLFIGQRIKEARKSTGLSQGELAKALGIKQGTLSDIERGDINVSSLQLIKICILLRKPIQYFFPSSLQREVSELEGQLLDTFHKLPERWQKRILQMVNLQWELYKRIQPYEQAGIPEEFYDILIWEQETNMELEEAMAELQESKEFEDFTEFYKKFTAWLEEAKKRIKAQ